MIEHLSVLFAPRGSAIGSDPVFIERIICGAVARAVRREAAREEKNGAPQWNAILSLSARAFAEPWPERARREAARAEKNGASQWNAILSLSARAFADSWPERPVAGSWKMAPLLSKPRSPIGCALLALAGELTRRAVDARPPGGQSMPGTQIRRTVGT